MLKQQPSSSGRKTLNGISSPAIMSSMGSNNNANRIAAGRNRNSVKLPSQVSPVFEGVYNNARMLHFLTAVVGSTCDIRVKNGNVYEGIFKTLSSKCELAVDAVHRRCEENGGGSSLAPPRREEITDTVVFSPSDLVTMTCRDVDLNFATRDTFTDSAISSSCMNGEHRDKVLQRWDGGDSNGESYELEADTSNGWDANEMFRYNEENYGVKSTYDSSLSMYTMPLEKSNSEGYRQREARATRIANEIESSPQYRYHLTMENEEGKTEEEKYSAVARDRDSGDRERGHESITVSSNRDCKYVPIPQRVRDMGLLTNGTRQDCERASGGGNPPLPGRVGSPLISRPTILNSTSRHTLPSSSNHPVISSDHNGSCQKGGACSANSYAPLAQSRPAEASAAPVAVASPPSPRSPVNPQPLSDSPRPVNGVSSRMSPKAQRPVQASRTTRIYSPHVASAATSRSLKSTISSSSQDPPVATSCLDTSSVTMATTKPSSPSPCFPVNADFNAASKSNPSPTVSEILSSTGPEQTEECIVSADAKTNKVQQKSQIEELRKFGKEFRLQPSSGVPCDPSNSTAPPADPVDSATAAEPKPSIKSEPLQALPVNEGTTVGNKESEGIASAIAQSAISDRRSPGMPQPARTPGSKETIPEVTDQVEDMTDQVKRSTLNPNAKEFNPNKVLLSLSKPTPTPPRPTPPSPSVLLQTPPGQGAIYSSPYLSYMSPIQIQSHSVQAPQVYQYMSTMSQGKYPRAKGSMVTPRPEHSSAAPTMLQAGPPLVASPYQQSYLQYAQQVLPTMGHYPGQAVFSVLQGGPRMLGSSGHPQAMAPTGPYSGQSEGPPGSQPPLFGSQSFSHHPSQPSSTPSGSQHPGPASGQGVQGGPQSLYAPLSVPTPPNMPPGHTSPQSSYPLQGYSLHGPQALPHTFASLGQLGQAHVPGTLTGPHHSGTHGGVMLLHAPTSQQNPSSGPQHSQHPLTPQQGAHPHYSYIGPQSAVQVQAHPPQQLPFHPAGN